jgi:hypothetical protein
MGSTSRVLLHVQQLQSALLHSANHKFITNEVGAGDTQGEGITSVLPQRTFYYNITNFHFPDENVYHVHTSFPFRTEKDDADSLTRQLMGRP